MSLSTIVNVNKKEVLLTIPIANYACPSRFVIYQPNLKKMILNVLLPLIKLEIQIFNTKYRLATLKMFV